MAASLLAIRRQVRAMREEEVSDASWFALPEDGDEDVDWTSFTVDIEGPESYTTNPVAGAVGERESPYKGGMFKIEIRLPSNYPQDPPDVKFATRIWHPQVDRESGKPCVDFLKEQWKPTLGLRDVLVMLRQLLGSPSASDNVNAEAAREITDGIDVFEAHARAETAKYATLD